MSDSYPPVSSYPQDGTPYPATTPSPANSPYPANTPYPTNTPYLANTPYPTNAGYGRPASFRSVPANWGWAVAAVIFFWPIGFSAVSAAGRVLPALLDGDVHAATRDSAKARRLGITALCIVGALFALYVVFIIVIIAVASNSSCSGSGC